MLHRTILHKMNHFRIRTYTEKDLEQIEKPTTDSGNLYGP